MCIDRYMGNYAFGVTKFGQLHVMDVERPGDFVLLPRLSLRLNQQWRTATDMQFVSLRNDQTPDQGASHDDLLIVNMACSEVVTLQVSYERETNFIKSCVIVHRFPNLHHALPLRSTFSIHGFLLTCSEDANIHVHTLRNPAHVCSILHDAAPIACDLNKSHTILASGDVQGTVYIWRCYGMPDPESYDPDAVSETGGLGAGLFQTVPANFIPVKPRKSCAEF